MSQEIQSSVEIFCLSHREDLLNGLGDIAVSKKRLDELDIPFRYKGNALAENRVFFSSLLESSEADVIGLVSARWDERSYGKAVPKLQDLKEFASRLGQNQGFAPDVLPVGSYFGLRRWLAYSEFVLPGIRPLLLDVIAKEKEASGHTRQVPRVYGQAVMGGQVILNKADMIKLQSFMRCHIDAVYDVFGLYPEYRYGCIRCGFESPEGIGRYDRTRLLAMFGERLLALFFILRPNIELVEFRIPSNPAPLDFIRSTIGERLRLLIPWVTLIKFRRLALKVTGLSKKCDHSWKGQPQADNLG